MASTVSSPLPPSRSAVILISGWDAFRLGALIFCIELLASFDFVDSLLCLLSVYFSATRLIDTGVLDYAGLAQHPCNVHTLQLSSPNSSVLLSRTMTHTHKKHFFNFIVQASIVIIRYYILPSPVRFSFKNLHQTPTSSSQSYPATHTSCSPSRRARYMSGSQHSTTRCTSPCTSRDSPLRTKTASSQERGCTCRSNVRLLFRSIAGRC